MPRGLLTIPDFIANAGGVICAAVEYRGGTPKAAFEAIAEKISSNTAQVLEETVGAKIQPRQAAMDLALQRVRRAMHYRRWS